MSTMAFAYLSFILWTSKGVVSEASSEKMCILCPNSNARNEGIRDPRFMSTSERTILAEEAHS